MQAPIDLDIAQDVATITIASAATRNALSERMWSLLADAAERAGRAPEAKVICIRGAGGHFAAGADIAEFDEVFATRKRAAEYFDTIERGVQAVAGLEKPTIAMIEGACVGGGLALALACDLRLAHQNARLGITPAKLGLVYSFADTKRLVDAVGLGAAKDLLFTSRILDAIDAREIGLVDSVHEPQLFEAAVREKCAAIASVSQWSVRRMKAVIRTIADGATSGPAEAHASLLEAIEQPDFAEGKSAFLAKRRPEFPFR